MARRDLCARTIKVRSSSGTIPSGPGEAGEDQQVGGADLEQERAGVVGEGADAVAARAPSRPARIAGTRPARPAGGRAGGRRATAASATTGRKASSTGRAKLWAESWRRRWATSARSPSPPASRTERVRWALAPLRRSTRASSARTATRRRDDERGAAAACRARRSPSRRRRRRPGRRSRRRRRRRSGRRRRRRRRARPVRTKAIEAVRRRALGANAARPAPGPGDDEHRQQRLELVADPVEADAEAGIRAEQGERGQRRAGDHVDRVGEDGEPRRRRQGRDSRAGAVRVAAASSGHSEEDQQPFGRLPRLERRPQQEDQRQVDDRQPGDADRRARAGGRG